MKTEQRIIIDLKDKIVSLGIADELPASGLIQNIHMRKVTVGQCKEAVLKYRKDDSSKHLHDG